MGLDRQRHAPAALPPGKTRHQLYWRLGALEPVWRGAENLASKVIRSRDRTARSESLYGLSYPERLGLYLVKCQLLRNPSKGKDLVRQRAKAPYWKNNKNRMRFTSSTITRQPCENSLCLSV